jgi:hypothetical protein
MALKLSAILLLTRQKRPSPVLVLNLKAAEDLLATNILVVLCSRMQGKSSNLDIPLTVKLIGKQFKAM